MILWNFLGKSEDGTKEHISSEAYNIKWGQSGDCPICGEVNLWLSTSFYNKRFKKKNSLFSSISRLWKPILKINIQLLALSNVISAIIATVENGVWNNILRIIMEIETEELENVIYVEM